MGERRLVQAILHLVPESCRAEAPLDPLVQLRPPARQAVDPYAVGDVVEDRLRKRVGLLEHHADPAPEPHDVHARGVDVHAVYEDTAVDAGARHDVVHPVERAEERALAASGRPNERRHDVGLERDGDIAQRALLAVVEVQADNVDLDRAIRAVRLGLTRPGGGEHRHRGSVGSQYDSSVSPPDVPLVSTMLNPRFAPAWTGTDPAVSRFGHGALAACSMRFVNSTELPGEGCGRAVPSVEPRSCASQQEIGTTGPPASWLTAARRAHPVHRIPRRRAA
jgi:hypothetical protein